MENSILDKIAKLYTKAQATDSEQEAQAFMAKVQELMLEHGLSLQSISGHKVKGPNSNPVEKNLFDVSQHSSKVEGEWVSKLIYGICRTNLGKAIREPKPFAKHANDCYMHIIAKKETIPLIVNLIEYLIPTVKRIEKLGWSQYGGEQKRGAYRREFYIACTIRLIERLKENMDKLAQENNKVTDLIRVSDTDISDYVAQEYPYLKSRSPRPVKIRDGFRDGHAAGGRVSLNSQINSGNPSKGRLS